MNEIFRKFAYKTAEAVGSPIAFVASVIIVVAWGVTGPMFNYSDTWQLVVNTATNIITFVIVFLIQYSQNRDTKVLQLKMAEMIRSIDAARNRFVDLENLSDEEITRLQKEFEQLSRRSRTKQPKQH